MLIELDNVSLAYPAARQTPATVILDGITLSIAENDLIALLGPSGCGKSTLVRLIAGLIAPTSGRVLFRGQEVRGVCPGVAMVFQNFALFPWLTVAGNVRLPLEQLGLEEAEIAARTAASLSMVGLDQYVNVHPRELSGGMKQRVGIARALAVHPEVLCMDEPFSALDVLTAESLRNELGRLCAESANPLRTMISVTHNIEEAVYLARRVIVLAAHPGRVALDLPNPLPYPRQPQTPEFRAVVEKIHAILTEHGLPTPAGGTTPAPSKGFPENVTIGEVIGLVNLCDGQPAEIFELADDLHEEFDAMLRVVHAAEMLGLVETPGDHVHLTPLGEKLQAATVAGVRQLLAEQVGRLDLFRRIATFLASRPDGHASFEAMSAELAGWFPGRPVEPIARSIFSWARYAGLVSYDTTAQKITLRNQV